MKSTPCHLPPVNTTTSRHLPLPTTPALGPMWKVNFHCPHCRKESKGLYNHVRLVMDMKEHYYVAGEYMDCKACSGTFTSWDQRMLSQLSDARFRVLMTRKYACDESVMVHSFAAAPWETAQQHSETLYMSCTVRSGYGGSLTTSATARSTKGEC